MSKLYSGKKGFDRSNLARLPLGWLTFCNSMPILLARDLSSTAWKWTHRACPLNFPKWSCLRRWESSASRSPRPSAILRSRSFVASFSWKISYSYFSSGQIRSHSSWDRVKLLPPRLKLIKCRVEFSKRNIRQVWMVVGRLAHSIAKRNLFLPAFIKRAY